MRRLTTSERLLLPVLVLALLGWGTYVYRYRIAAWRWHSQHGDVLQLGDYRLPVPQDWYVENVSPARQVLIRVDTTGWQGAAFSSNLRFTAVINATLRAVEWPKGKVEAEMKFQTDQFKRRGVEPEVRVIDLAGEPLHCLGGQKLSATAGASLAYQSDPDVWRCWSAGRLQLDITAVEQQMPEVWSIVARINSNL